MQARVQAAGQRFAKAQARLEEDEAALARDRSEQVSISSVFPIFYFFRPFVAVWAELLGALARRAGDEAALARDRLKQACC